MGYTAEDEALIREKWDDLLFSCTKICKNDEDWNFIKRAFFLAKEAHEGVRRRSGEPYLLHPIAVAKIVIDEIGLGVKSVVAALLHDVVEDTEYTVEDMERIFGPKIASMVDGLTKMAGVFNADTSEQAEYFRKVLLTLSDDVRVILIKIADRLHNMRTLGSMPMNKQIKITGETIYLFAPLAYRLGLYSIKSELEDLCMKYRFPQQYAEITQKLQESEASRREFIDKFSAPIVAALNRDNFNYEISGRVKSVYSIWIERMPLPFAAVAADLLTGREVVLDSGGLYDAIRASISIPSVFRPVRRDGMVLIDGGTVNPLPLNRVRREEGDLLIAVDVCAPFAAAPAAGKVSLNYYRMLTASSQIMQQHIAGLMRRLYRPDVVVELPADSFSMFEFYRSEEIVEAGRRATCEALERRAAGD